MVALPPLGARAIHVVVDMQRMFAEPGRWQVTDMPRIVPNVLTLASALPERTLFTRFYVADSAGAAPGRWRSYYEHWSDFTGANLEAGKIELIDALAALADPKAVFDKPTYSAFEVPSFVSRLEALQADTLIFSGVETDVCVLGTLLAAVDRGYHAIAVEDAMTSSSSAGHEATLKHVLTRLDRQVDIAPTAAILAALG